MTPNSPTSAVAANSESSRSRTFRAVVLPLAVAIFMLVVSTLAWYYTAQSVERLSQLELQRNLSSLSRTIDESRNARLQALDRLRRRMESINHYQAPSFKLDANIYLNDFPSFRSLAWIDKDLAVIEWLNQPAIADSPSCDRDVTCQALLQSVLREGIDKTANPQLRADGGLGQWIALSVKPLNKEPGLLLVQLDYSVMLQRTMRNALPDSPLRVSFAGKPIYARNVPIDLPTASLDHSVGTVALRLDTWKIAGASTANLPNILLIFGLTVGGLLAMALRLESLARQRADIAEVAERDLRLTIVERQRARQDLDDTEKELSALVEDMADGFVMLDAEWNFVYLNHRAEVILRRSREQLIGTYCWAEFPEAVDNPMYQAYQQAVQSGEAVSLETYYPPLECWLEIRAHPYPKGLAVYFQDVSSRKKNAEKLSHTENLLRIAGRTAHFGGWSLDVANGQILWSDEVCSIHGMPPGYSPSLDENINFYAPVSQNLVKELIRKCVSEAIAFDEELQIISTLGDLLWVRAIGQPVIDNNGKVVKVNGAFQEIDERKRNDEDRAKESLFLKSVLENLSEGIVACDAHGKLSLFNRATREFHGLPEQALTPEHWSQYDNLFLPDGVTPMSMEQIPLFRALRGEVVRDVEMVIKPTNQPARWVLCNGEKINTDTGKLLGAVVVMYDITEHKRFEQLDAEQRTILSGIASRQPLANTLEAVVRLYERQCSGALCSVILLAEDGVTLQHGAAPSLPEAFNTAVHGEKIGEGAGSCGTALHRGERVIVSDIANDPLWKNYAALALAHNLRACWSTPIKAPDGTAVATFAVYYREVREPNEVELQTIDDIAALAGIAIEQSNAYLNLTRSEQRFRSLFYEHPDAVCAMDLDGRFVDYNGGFYASTGISPVDVIGQMFDERIAPENRQSVREHFNAAAKGEAQTYESTGVAATGERFDFRVTNLPIMVEGKITGVFGIAHDITGLRKHERELAEALTRAQENSRQLRRLSQVAMVINQQVGQDANLNQELVHLLRDTVGVHQAIISLVQDHGIARDIDVVSLSDKYSQWRNRSMAFDNSEVSALLSHTDGSLRLTQDELAKHPRWSNPGSEAAMRPPMRGLLAVPLIGRDGSNIGLLQLSDKLEGDFTGDDELIAVQFAGMAATAIERSRLIERLRERDKFFEMSLEIFVMYNPATQKWVQVNPVFAQLTGYSQEELCAVEFIHFLHPADRPAAEERSRLLRTGQGVVNSFINRYVCRDGSLRWIEWVSVPSPEGLVYGVGRDISERRKSEIALQQTLVNLNNRNRELQDFAFVASHDLQEPLRKIRAFSDRLTTRYRDTLEEQARDYLDRMNQAATRMQVLIDDLLAYSHVATRGKPFTKVNLATICAEVIADLDARIESTQARISYTSLPSITGDATQMRQLFQNLLANALKFHSPDRPPEIMITWTTVTGDKEPSFCLEFSDNGIGFEHKYAERIFTPFQRLHSRAEYEGTGIGLAIVRRIVERHHGSIEAFSEPNIGSRFVICIPQTQPSEQPTPITSNPLIN